MTLTAPREIRSDDILLRRLTIDDIEAFGDFMARPENTRFMTFPDEVKNRDAAAEIVRDTIKTYTTPTASMALAICRPEDPKMIGACGAYQTSEHTIEVFFLVFEAHRNRGYATQAARALVGHLRAAHPAHDLTAVVDPRNDRSPRILERLGFRDRGDTALDGRPGRCFALAAASATPNDTREDRP